MFADIYFRTILNKNVTVGMLRPVLIGRYTEPHLGCMFVAPPEPSIEALVICAAGFHSHCLANGPPPVPIAGGLAV